MSRAVWPHLFMLRAALVLNASPNPTLSSVQQTPLSSVLKQYFPSATGLQAVALRWFSKDTLGFPREPFQVYRRARGGMESSAYVTVESARVTLAGTSQTFPVLVNNDPAYVVRTSVTVASPNVVTLQAVDTFGRLIPDQLIYMTGNGFAEFRCPGIAAVTITGTGAIGPIAAISETVYANLPDWVQTQTVGLPLANNEIGASYKTSPQGFWVNPTTPPTMDGVSAAQLRTLVTTLLQTQPPATGIADFPVPSWPAPSPNAYIAYIRGANGFVPVIERCLRKAVDTDINNLQCEYSDTLSIDGLSQIGTAPSTQTTQVTLPVTGVTMLAVSTDQYASVSLGYGTVDLPPATNNTSNPVTVTPATAGLLINKTQQFTANVISTIGGAGVVWSVNGVPGGNSTLGTISSTGLYTAPAAVPTPATVTVYASSVQNPSSSGSASVSIQAFIILIPTQPVLTEPVVTTPVVTQPVAVKPVEISATLKTAVAHEATLVNPSPTAISTVATSTTATGGATATTSTGASSTSTSPAPIQVEIFILPTSYPAVENYGNYDYMVTAPFVNPFFSATLAALSAGQPAVAPPAALLSALSQINAPISRDQAAQAAVRVSWNPPTNPQGYGLLLSTASNASSVLNEPCPAGGFFSFVAITPVNPDPNSPPDQQNPAFSDVGASIPIKAPPMKRRYMVAGQDFFGKWSNWAEADTTVSPSPVTKPGLISAEFIYAASSPPTSVISATLRIDFAWNWQDRSPGQIRFTGEFVPAPATTLNPGYLGGFAMKNTGSPGAPVILSFDYTGVTAATVSPAQMIPRIDSGHTTNGPVRILGGGSPPTPPGNPEQVQYRVEITGIQLDFSTASELDFLLYATATENIQPGVWSDLTDQPSIVTSPPAPPLLIGKIIRAMNPNPPVITFTPPPLTWTALPDATGNARGVLSWSADPTATGYFVWEATESALLHFLPPGNPTPDAPPGTPAMTRATTLNNLIHANQDASMQGFSRLNDQPITTTRTEITVPGSADVLYVYRVSAIGANNVESDRSPSVAIVGVPRRNVPGTPRILLRSASTGSPSGIEVIVLPVESSAPPAGYRVFRVRNQALTGDGTTMGPPKLSETSPLWQNYSSTTPQGRILEGKSILDTAAVPSWYPYFYRATAIGAQDLPNGLYSGESEYSTLQSGYNMPANAPMLSSMQVKFTITKNEALITLTTDLPATLSPIGSARVELFRLVPPAGGGSLQQQGILSSATDQMTQGTLTLPLTPILKKPLPVVTAKMARSAPDANGHWILYVLIPYAASEAGSFVVRLTDPLARQSTASF